MAIDRDYMLKKPSPPSATRQFLDQRVLPPAVNVAGSLEVALNRVADRIGVRPAVIVAGAAAGLSILLARRWRTRRMLS